MDPQLRAAVLGSSDIQAPAAPQPQWASPEIAQANQIKFQLPQSNAGANAIVQQSSMDVKAQEEAAALEKKKAEAMLNPNNYQQIPKADGGYTFLDPMGKEISAHDYARVVGKPVNSLLADSENPIDIAFNEDYQNLQDYISAKINSKNDPDAASLAKQYEDKVKESYGIDMGSMDPKQVIEQFKRAYPTVFGGKGAGMGQGTQTVIPNYGAPQTAVPGGGAISIGQ